MGRRDKVWHPLFGVVLMLIMMFAMSTAVLAKEEVTYLDWSRNQHKHVEKTCTDYTFVQGSTGDVVWGDSVEDDSWYVVDGQVSIDGRIKVRGDVHLILKDGATLYANKGIYTEGILSDRGNLAIYGQSKCTGILNARSYGDSAIKIVGGDLSIDGGNINAYEGVDGISVKQNRLGGGCLDINGGYINATGDNTGITADMNCAINWGVTYASGSAHGISTSVLMMLDGYLTAYGPDGYGIDAAVGINDGLIVMAGDSEASLERIDRDYFEHDHYQRCVSIVKEAGDSSGVISYDVDDSESYIAILTFRVKNGAWDDGTTEDKYAILVGKDSSNLKLTEHDIPAVGKKPDQGYEAGSWDVTPSTDTAITKETTYTYTYAKEDAPTPTPVSTAKPVAVVKGVAKGNTSLNFTWNKVIGAAKYEIWMSRCNTSKKKYSVKKVKTLDAPKTTWIKKKLKKNTGYKFRLVAKDASGKVIGKSIICHAYTGNVWGKYTNVKSLKLAKKSYTLKKGGKAKIKAIQIKARPDKKLCSHAKKLRYRSNNTSVARVDKNGNIKAVDTGECRVYVQTVNGIWKTVTVSVN